MFQIGSGLGPQVKYRTYGFYYYETNAPSQREGRMTQEDPCSCSNNDLAHPSTSQLLARIGEDGEIFTG